MDELFFHYVHACMFIIGGSGGGGDNLTRGLAGHGVVAAREVRTLVMGDVWCTT